MQNVIQRDRYSACVIPLFSAALPYIHLLNNWPAIFILMQLRLFHLPYNADFCAVSM